MCCLAVQQGWLVTTHCAVLCCVTHTSGRRTHRCSTVHPQCNPHWSAVLCAGSLQWHVGGTNKAGKARHPLCSRHGQHSKAASLADQPSRGMGSLQGSGTESVTHMSYTSQAEAKESSLPLPPPPALLLVLTFSEVTLVRAALRVPLALLATWKGVRGTACAGTRSSQSAQHTHMLALQCLPTHSAALVTT